MEGRGRRKIERLNSEGGNYSGNKALSIEEVLLPFRGSISNGIELEFEEGQSVTQYLAAADAKINRESEEVEAESPAACVL